MKSKQIANKNQQPDKKENKTKTVIKILTKVYAKGWVIIYKGVGDYIQRGG